MHLQPRAFTVRPSGSTQVSMDDNGGSLDFAFYLKIAYNLFSDLQSAKDVD